MPPDSAQHDQPTPTPAAATVGGMDPRTAGALELARGLGTTGGGVLLIWYLLTGEIEQLAHRLDERTAGTDARIAALTAEVGSLRVDVARLQVQVQREPAIPR